MTTRTVLGVTGPIGRENWGACLFHEHVALDMSDLREDPDVSLTKPAQVCASIQAALEAGIRTIVDATTADIGRNVGMLRNVVEETGCQLIASTGFHHSETYPDWVRRAEQQQLADYFIQELSGGLEGGIAAGAIAELGTAGASFDPVEARVFEAAADAHRETSAAIITHTAEGALAIEQADLLEQAGVEPSRVAIGHVDCADSSDLAIGLAKRGFFVGIDRCGIEWLQPDTRRVEFVLDLIDAGLSDRILLSSDVARRSRMPESGKLGYATVPTSFVPQLLAAGVSQTTIDEILIGNPWELLSST